VVGAVHAMHRASANLALRMCGAPVRARQGVAALCDFRAACGLASGGGSPVRVA
jgi:hypothetical protein